MPLNLLVCAVAVIAIVCAGWDQGTGPCIALREPQCVGHFGAGPKEDLVRCLPTERWMWHLRVVLVDVEFDHRTNTRHTVDTSFRQSNRQKERCHRTKVLGRMIVIALSTGPKTGAARASTSRSWARGRGLARNDARR